ncbi:hypothetical protein FIM08_03140 [SAR202 cluster bacterium AC-647-N09_OGT_505m]|nr:hypothetical protein [SAR202 cluster bacterium AC-647-N09_OGT_505m]
MDLQLIPKCGAPEIETTSKNQLSMPLVLIGIQPPLSFVMDHYVNSAGKTRARFKSTAFPYDFIKP